MIVSLLMHGKNRTITNLNSTHSRPKLENWPLRTWMVVPSQSVMAVFLVH